MNKNSINWDKGVVLALLALVIAALTLVATFTVPEIRDFFGLDEPAEPKSLIVQRPEPEDEKKEPPEKVGILEPTGPVFLTIHEKQPQFDKKAQVTLSVIFHDILGENVASLTIAPTGKESSIHSALDGYTQEFTSSVGTFLVQVLHVDYEEKSIDIQVTSN